MSGPPIRRQSRGASTARRHADRHQHACTRGPRHRRRRRRQAGEAWIHQPAGTTASIAIRSRPRPSKAVEVDLARPLTREQESAVTRLCAFVDDRRFQVALLHGVTGSGKTEIYLRLATHVRDAGRRTLMLVPEIALTPVVTSLFREAFGARVAIQHSGLSDGERHDQWQRIRRGEVDVVVGTRSAVFAPLEHVGRSSSTKSTMGRTNRKRARDTTDATWPSCEASVPTLSWCSGRRRRRWRVIRMRCRAGTSESCSNAVCSIVRWPR